MSIFIDKEVKKESLNYWFGLGFPIVIGFLITLFPFISYVVFEDIFLNNQFNYIEYFVFIIGNSGHLVIWPLLAWWLQSRALKNENSSCEEGANLSIRLYVIWIVFIIIPLLIFEIFWGM